MALTCGFFNSIDGDRKYNAEQMNNPYRRIVSNGVFAMPDGSKSTDFQVIADGTMTVKVNEGDGIFDGKWATSDVKLPITVPLADVTNPRIDSIAFRIDYDMRAGLIILKKGTPSANPTPPAMQRNNQAVEYRLADIRVNANAKGLTQANITDTRAGEECGFVTHLLQQADISQTYIQWQAQFEEWFQDVKETLSTAKLIRSYTSQYITLTQGETQIPINITQYNKNLDILQVFVNGLRLIPDVEYTINSNSQITLAKDLDINQTVAFVVYKSVDGSDAETVVQEVYELQILLDRLKVTSDTGSTKINVNSGADPLVAFVNAGKGFHTMYIQSGALGMPAVGVFRAFGHLTGETEGWIIALQASGSVYANYFNEGVWRGWRAIFEMSPAPLYYSESGVFPTAGTNITPSKPLSECQHGWNLVFCGYDDVGKAARDVYVQTFNIPKKSHKNAEWNGESVSIPLIYQYVTESDSSLICQKTLNVYNDRIVGGTTASTGKQRNMVLKAIYEY